MENTLQNSMESSNLGDYMLQKKIEIMMDMAAKKVAGELNKVTSMVTKLNEDMVEIKRQLSEGKHVVNTRPAAIAEDAIIENTKTMEPLQVKSIRREEPVSKPRYGDYQPEDVRIDKFFYFGNKK